MTEDPIQHKREEERFNRAAVTAALSALGIAVVPALPLAVLGQLLEAAHRALGAQGEKQ